MLGYCNNCQHEHAKRMHLALCGKIAQRARAYCAALVRLQMSWRKKLYFALAEILTSDSISAQYS